eukprot:3414493-Pyramimonas_sp.AAC.1
MLYRCTPIGYVRGICCIVLFFGRDPAGHAPHNTTRRHHTSAAQRPTDRWPNRVGERGAAHFTQPALERLECSTSVTM